MRTTTDVCKLDFPPVSYGDSLAQIEKTIQQVIETIFRDQSGLIISGVNGLTMKPLRPEDVPDRQLGIGGWWENACMPREYKNLAMNFENCHQCSGKYLDGLVDKYAVTRDEKVLGYAKKIAHTTHQLWETAAKTHRYGKGWLPKPYAGMNLIPEMCETSVDQYSDITFGLEKYYNELADRQERAFLAEMLLSFADWWLDHNYTTSFMGTTVWWDRVHTLAQSYFLYLFQLAYSLVPRKKYLDGFDYIFSRAEKELVTREGAYNGENFNPNTSGIVIEAMSRIAKINPSLKVFCHNCIQAYIPAMIEAGNRGAAGNDLDPIFNLRLFTAKYLSHAHEFCKDDALVKYMIEYISTIKSRSDFYHVKRGLSLDDGVLERMHVDKSDYRDVFWVEEQCCWLTTYWYLRRSNKITPNQ
ncbi:MAG: hypothetical protein ACYC3B_07880 [Sedimentisphaerales bacterium]